MKIFAKGCIACRAVIKDCMSLLLRSPQQRGPNNPHNCFSRGVRPHPNVIMGKFGPILDDWVQKGEGRILIEPYLRSKSP